MAKDIVSGDTAEAVAYALMLDVFAGLDKLHGGTPVAGVTEVQILNLYTLCLDAARGQRFGKKP